MSMLKVDGVTHWSIPVNDLEEAEKFYTEVLGLNYVGRLGDSGLSCVTAGSHSILLCRRNEPVVRTPEQDNHLHHAFDVSPEMFERACKLFHDRGISIVELIYRERGVFPGREAHSRGDRAIKVMGTSFVEYLLLRLSILSGEKRSSCSLIPARLTPGSLPGSPSAGSGAHRAAAGADH